jgi:hypothetical protein
MIMLVSGILLLALDARYHWQNRATAARGLLLLLLLALPLIRFFLQYPLEFQNRFELYQSYWLAAIPLSAKIGIYLQRYLNGFNFYRSGDIAFELQPDYLTSYSGKGTTHSTKYSYDTHIPLIFFGWHIPKKTVNDPVYTVDIAPTIANLLGITEPNACIGIPIIR